MRKKYQEFTAGLSPRWRYWLKEWIEPILLAIILALIIRTFFFQAFKIPTGSMRPTLIEQDRVLVNKILYKYRDPQRGDIIVFRYPADGKRDFIKRLVGLPGETLEIKQGKLWVNGELVAEDSVLRRFYYYNRDDWMHGKGDQIVKIPDKSYFVLGDNSAQSSDSRNWGFVPEENVIGKAFMIYWPPKRIRVTE